MCAASLASKCAACSPLCTFQANHASCPRSPFAEHRRKKAAGNNAAPMPRAVDAERSRTKERMTRELGALGLDASELFESFLVHLGCGWALASGGIVQELRSSLLFGCAPCLLCRKRLASPACTKPHHRACGVQAAACH